MAVTVHYIKASDSEWAIKKGTCACEVFDGSHTGARIGAKLMNTLKSLGIDKSVVSVTSDTASNMRNAIESHTPRGIEWIGCAAHKMERTVQNYVKDPVLKQTLSVFNKVAAHLHKSALSQQTFEQAQKVSLPIFAVLYLLLKAARWSKSQCHFLETILLFLCDSSQLVFSCYFSMLPLFWRSHTSYYRQNLFSIILNNRLSYMPHNVFGQNDLYDNSFISYPLNVKFPGMMYATGEVPAQATKEDPSRLRYALVVVVEYAVGGGRSQEQRGVNDRDRERSPVGSEHRNFGR